MTDQDKNRASDLDDTELEQVSGGVHGSAAPNSGITAKSVDGATRPGAIRGVSGSAAPNSGIAGSAAPNSGVKSGR